MLSNLNLGVLFKFAGGFMGACLMIFLISGCDEKPSKAYQGYVEGEFVYVAAPIAGRLDVLKVERGRQVKKGDLLLKLEGDYREEVAQEALNRQNQAMHTLANLKKGKRPSEIKSIEARLKKVKEGLKLAKLEYTRRKKLIKKQFISEEQLDKARTEYKQQLQQVQEITAQIDTARLGARTDEIKAAEAEVKVAQAKLAQARWSIDQMTQYAKVNGLVFDILYYPGEWVPAGRPVVSILPPENIKIRFFVPERKVGKLSLGQKVFVSFDGGSPLPAKIAFISPRAQYTPPVIYSSQSRAKLVFMVEAVPAADSRRLLHPGQPVDVRETLEEKPGG